MASPLSVPAGELPRVGQGGQTATQARRRAVLQAALDSGEAWLSPEPDGARVVWSDRGDWAFVDAAGVPDPRTYAPEQVRRA